jgi:anti-anti-sigma factor
MDLATKHDGKSLIVSLIGRLDVVNAPRFEANMLEEVQRGETSFILDLAGLDYISSAGLRALLVLAKRVQAQQGQLYLCGLCGGVREVFDVSGFSGIFACCPDLAAAQARRG